MQQSEADCIIKEINKMPENGLMVEWGAGGSTCLWLENLQPSQKLISIEHNRNWKLLVEDAIETEFGDVSNQFTLLFQPRLVNYIHYDASYTEENPCGMEEYINPKTDVFNADLYFVDGIDRGSCLVAILLQRKKENSIILMHDYVGRESWYKWASQFFNIEVLNGTLIKLTAKK